MMYPPIFSYFKLVTKVKSNAKKFTNIMKSYDVNEDISGQLESKEVYLKRLFFLLSLLLFRR